MSLSHKNRGKEFEGEFSGACRALKNDRKLPLAYWNSNEPKPCCDARLVFFGVAVLVECKETRGDRFQRSEITKRERENLELQHDAWGLGVIAIKHIDGSRSRCFLVSWLNWLQMEARGIRGFGLANGQRPPELLEVFRVTRPQGLGRAWDLYPVLAKSCVAYLDFNLKRARDLGHGGE